MSKFGTFACERASLHAHDLTLLCIHATVCLCAGMYVFVYVSAHTHVCLLIPLNERKVQCRILISGDFWQHPHQTKHQQCVLCKCVYHVCFQTWHEAFGWNRWQNVTLKSTSPPATAHHLDYWTYPFLHIRLNRRSMFPSFHGKCQSRQTHQSRFIKCLAVGPVTTAVTCALHMSA